MLHTNGLGASHGVAPTSPTGGPSTPYRLRFDPSSRRTPQTRSRPCRSFFWSYCVQAPGVPSVSTRTPQRARRYWRSMYAPEFGIGPCARALATGRRSSAPLYEGPLAQPPDFAVHGEGRGPVERSPEGPSTESSARSIAALSERYDWASFWRLSASLRVDRDGEVGIRLVVDGDVEVAAVAIQDTPTPSISTISDPIRPSSFASGAACARRVSEHVEDGIMMICSGPRRVSPSSRSERDGRPGELGSGIGHTSACDLSPHNRQRRRRAAAAAAPDPTGTADDEGGPGHPPRSNRSADPPLRCFIEAPSTRRYGFQPFGVRPRRIGPRRSPFGFRARTSAMPSPW